MGKSQLDAEPGHIGAVNHLLRIFEYRWWV